MSCASSANENPSSHTRIGLELVVEGFTAAVELASPGDGSGRLFVADQDGEIWILNSSGDQEGQLFLDLRERVMSLNMAYETTASPRRAKSTRRSRVSSMRLTSGLPTS